MGNLGHRLGEVDKTHKENTIERFKSNFKYMLLDDYKYVEFDINETFDNELIVFHDRDFKKYGDKRKVRDLFLKEIKETYPFIPTLDELFDVISMYYDEHKFSTLRPVRIEIKRLISPLGRSKAIEKAGKLRESISESVDFIAFRSHWKKSFPKKTRHHWEEAFHARGFHIWNVKNKKKCLFKSKSSWDWFLNWL